VVSCFDPDAQWFGKKHTSLAVFPPGLPEDHAFANLKGSGSFCDTFTCVSAAATGA
jgi:hypothetical protein